MGDAFLSYLAATKNNIGRKVVKLANLVLNVRKERAKPLDDG